METAISKRMRTEKQPPRILEECGSPTTSTRSIIGGLGGPATAVALAKSFHWESLLTRRAYWLVTLGMRCDARKLDIAYHFHR